MIRVRGARGDPPLPQLIPDGAPRITAEREGKVKFIPADVDAAPAAQSQAKIEDILAGAKYHVRAVADAQSAGAQASVQSQQRVGPVNVDLQVGKVGGRGTSIRTVGQIQRSEKSVIIRDARVAVDDRATVQRERIRR